MGVSCISDPLRTAQRLCQNPLRCGPVVSNRGFGLRRGDGVLEYVGHRPSGEKIRGCRIELEKRACMSSLKCGDAAVDVQEASAAKHLVGWWPADARKLNPGERLGRIQATPAGRAAGIHGAVALVVARPVAAERQRQAGPQGLAGTGDRPTTARIIGAAQ